MKTEFYNVCKNRISRHKKCSYSEFFWPVLSRIRTEYGDILCKFSHSVQMWENTNQKNSECKHYLRSFICPKESQGCFLYIHRDFFFIYISLHKNWSFPLRVSLVIVTKSTVSCIFSHIHWRNPWWKTSFFVESLHNYIMSLRCGPKHQFCRIILNRCSRVLFSLLSYCF